MSLSGVQMARPDIRSRPGDIWLSLYLIASWFAAPVFWLVHWVRIRTGKDDPSRGRERFGHSTLERPKGQLVWIHAASVGETNSVLPLIEALTGSGLNVLLTTVTVTSADIAARSLPEGAVHQYAPYDAPAALERFLDHWRPSLAAMVESEIWPGMLTVTARNGIPIAIVNGRLSERSARSWGRTGSFGRAVFALIDLCLAQSDADADRYRGLGVGKVSTPGNLKFDAVPPGAADEEITELRRAIGNRQVFLAASTHPGEDEIAFDAYQDLKSQLGDLLLVLVPRHPVRGPEIARLAESRGLKAARRGAKAELTPDIDVYIADTLGEMGLFYRVADVAFIGGSFAPVGGHNPVEAVGLGVPLIAGPKVAKARAVYKEMWNKGAAVRAETPNELIDAARHLFLDEAARQAMREQARMVIDQGQGALDRTLADLQPFLDDMCDKDPAKQVAS